MDDSSRPRPVPPPKKLKSLSQASSQWHTSPSLLSHTGAASASLDDSPTPASPTAAVETPTTATQASPVLAPVSTSAASVPPLIATMLAERLDNDGVERSPPIPPRKSRHNFRRTQSDTPGAFEPVGSASPTSTPAPQQANDDVPASATPPTASKPLPIVPSGSSLSVRSSMPASLASSPPAFAPASNQTVTPIGGKPNPLTFPNDSRSKVAMELFTTEQTYMQVLDAVVEVFLQPLRSSDLVPHAQIQSIFSNIEMIREFNNDLLLNLGGRLATWTVDNPDEHLLAELFLEMIPKFPIYTIYCNNFDSAIQELQKLEKKRKEVKDFMDERATHPRCAGLRLPSLLVTPVQRIPRYMLLFKELVEKTPSSHPDYPSLQLTFTKFRDLADFVNNSIRDHENLKKLGDLKKNISGLQALETSNRTLQKEGPVSLITPKKKYQCVLFNDILVFAERNVSRVFEVRVVLDLNTIWLEDLEDLDPQTTSEDSVEIYTPERPFIVYFGSLSNKKLWINSVRKGIADSLGVPEAEISVRRDSQYQYKDGSYYIGDWFDAMRHGTGKLVLSNKTYYEGQFVNDVRQGHGTMYYHTGEVFEGEWLNNLPHGKGKLTLVDGNVYEGEWRKGQKSGVGKITYRNNDVFEGMFANDQINGFGTLSSANGCSYAGLWVDNQWEGEGTLTTLSEVYQGEFKSNMRNGYGELTYKDSSKYAGEFKDDKRHGKGVYSSKLGEFYEGKWFGDLYEGDGVLVYPNKNRYEGEFRSGQRHGKGVCTFPWGDRYDGNWDGDVYHGMGSYTSANGESFKGFFVRGKKEGMGTYVYVDGSKYEGPWRNNKRDGEGQLVYSDRSTYVGSFLNDKRHGFGMWTAADKKTRYTGDWAYDRREGRGILQTESGKYEGQFSQDKFHGQGVFLSGVGTRYEGTWHMDKKLGKGKLTYVTGATEVLTWREGTLVTPGFGFVAPELPDVPQLMHSR